MGPEQQGPRSGAERAGTQAWGGGALSPTQPHPGGRETPQHGVNRGDFPGPQGEAGSWSRQPVRQWAKAGAGPTHMPRPGARDGGEGTFPKREGRRWASQEDS